MQAAGGSMKVVFLVILFSVGALAGSWQKGVSVSKERASARAVGERGADRVEQAESPDEANLEGGAAPGQIEWEWLDTRSLSSRLFSTEPKAFFRAVSAKDDEVLAAALTHLFDRSPQVALDFLQSNLHGEHSFDLVADWAVRNPVLVTRWLGNVALKLGEEERTELATIAFSELAKFDPLQATAQSAEMLDPSERKKVLLTAAEALGKGDHGVAFAWLESLSGDVTVSLATISRSYGTIVREHARRDPLDAAAIVGALQSPRLQRDLAGTVVENLVASDPDLAVKWVDSLRDPAAQAAGWDSLLSHASSDYRDSIVDLVLDRGELFETPSIQRFELIRNLSEKAVGSVIERFETVFSSDAQGMAAAAITSQLLKSGEEATAEDWARSALNGEAYDRAAGLIAERYAFLAGDAPLAFEWADSIESPQVRSRLFDSMVERLDPSSLTQLEEFVARSSVPDREAKEIGLRIQERLRFHSPQLALPGGGSDR